MTASITAFGLYHELTHRKHYSAKKSNPPMSYIGQHKQGDQTHVALLKTLLPALVAVPFTPLEASPTSLARALARCSAQSNLQTAAWANHHQELCPAAKEDVWCGIVQPCKSSVSSLDYKIFNNLNGLFLHQTHSVKALKALNNRFWKYSDMLSGWTGSWKSNKRKLLAKRA